MVSVIGDGALTGGMAYEALNNAAELKTNFIIIINDNNMSISRECRRNVHLFKCPAYSRAYTGMKMGVTKALKKIPHVGTQWSRERQKQHQAAFHSGNAF